MDQKTLETFKDYVSIKLHFNEPSFVWHERMQQDRITIATLMKRKDMKFIVKFSSMFRKREDQRQYLISSFLHDPSSWIGAIMDDEYKARHKARLKRCAALKIDFDSQVENVIDFMKDNRMSIKNLLLTYGGRPAIIARQQEIVGGVSDEFLAVLDKGFKFCKQPTTDPLWQQKSFLLHKYSYLIKFDNKRLKGTLEKLAAIEGQSPVDRATITQHEEVSKVCHLPI